MDNSLKFHAVKCDGKATWRPKVIISANRQKRKAFALKCGAKWAIRSSCLAVPCVG